MRNRLPSTNTVPSKNINDLHTPTKRTTTVVHQFCSVWSNPKPLSNQTRHVVSVCLSHRASLSRSIVAFHETLLFPEALGIFDASSNMFLVNWVYSALNYLGLYYKNAKILFLGLDNAGKSTLLHMLKEDKVSSMKPTERATSEELTLGKVKFTAFDLGGHEQARRVWTDYFHKVDAIVFLVDSYDKARFNECKRELHGLLSNEQLKNVPFLILGNKIDLSGAASEEELRQALGIANITTGKGTVPVKDIRPIEVFMCTIVKKAGYREGFMWLSQYLN